MKSFSLNVIFSVLIFVGIVHSDEETELELPKKVGCSPTELDLNECFKELLQEQMSKLVKGSKALNIPVLDPWEIKDDNLEATYASIQANLTLDHIKVVGLSKTLINNVRAKMNQKGLVMKIDVLFPKLIIEGNYKTYVHVNDVALKPNGFFNLTISAISNKASIVGIFENKNRNKILKLKKFTVDPEVADMKFYATGLWEEPATNTLIVDFVNQYWRYFYRYFVNEGKGDWGIMLRDITNKFLENVPFEK